MKQWMKLVSAAAVCLSAVTGVASEVTLECGESRVISRPYTFRYRLEGGSSLVSEATGRHTEVRVTAGNEADSATLVLVRQNGTQERLRIRVLDAAGRYRQALTKALAAEDFGVRVRGTDGAVLGTVRSPEVLAQVTQTVTSLAEEYGTAPVPILARVDLAALQSQLAGALQQEGYAVLPRVSEKSRLNELSVTAEGGKLVVRGRTVSEEAVKQIDAAAARLQLPCENLVTVDKRIRLVMKSWLLVTTGEEEEKYGSLNAFSVGSVVDLVWDRHQGSSSGNTGTLTLTGSPGINQNTFYIGEGMTRSMREVSILFANHAEEMATGNVGGTLFVNTGAGDGDGDGDVQERDFGFTVEVKGGLESPDEVLLEEFTVSRMGAPQVMGHSAFVSGDRVEITSPNIPLEIGSTVVLLNNRDQSLEWTEPSGVPILRHIPLLGWLFSEERRSSQQIRIILLGQVTYADQEEIHLPKGTKTQTVVDEISRKLNEQ